MAPDTTRPTVPGYREKWPMRDKNDLQRILSRIDGLGYKAYKDLRGDYAFGQFTLYIDHVQGDPFASPSKVRVRVAQDLAQLLGLPARVDKDEALLARV